MHKRAYVDANVILRFLLGEPKDQSLAAEELFLRAERGECDLVIHPAVLAEVVYVLTSARLAGLSRAEVARTLGALVMLEGVEVTDLEAVVDGLRRFEQTCLDWVDCLLLGYTGAADVFTFDRDIIAHGARVPGGDGTERP